MDTLDDLKSYSKTAQITTFYLEAIKICRKKGIKYTFVCPLCGGIAHVKKTMKSAIIHAYCDDCKVRIKEK